MSAVPYIFADQDGPIPLSELDQNFANVKAFADSAGVVTASAQPAITSVGTLTTLVSSGNITGSNLISTGAIVGTLSTSTQANITSVGTLNGLSVTGNINATGNVNGANLSATLISGLLMTEQQINITQVGNLVSLVVDGNISGSNLSITDSATVGSATVNGNLIANNLSVTNAIDADSVTVSGTTLDSTGNISTGNLSVSGSAAISGSATITGNLTVSGTTTTVNSQTLNIADKSITVANNVSTSLLIDGAGIDAGNPTVSYIRYSDASKGWNTANNFSVGGNLAVTGIATASTAANNISSTQLATTEFVRNIIPTGLISLWYGAVNAVPDGWYLCDGNNGTPDLTDRFVVGAGGSYDPGDTGGADSVTPTGNISGTVGGTSLTEAQMPKHYHLMLGPNNVSSPQGSGSGVGVYGGGTPDDGTQAYGTYSTGGSAASGTQTTGTSSGDSHTHSFSGSFTGDSQENRPAYYALAYIMKA